MYPLKITVRSILLYISMPLWLGADFDETIRTPIHILKHENSTPSLVNSVDFHPTTNQFCVTYTHQHSVVIFQLDEAGKTTVFQVLQGDATQLSSPQHAVYSKDGHSLVVANWSNKTFSVYKADEKGFYQQTPIAVIPFFSPPEPFRPHGIAFSPDGNHLAVAFGASKTHPKAVAIYQVNDLGTSQVTFQLRSLLQENVIHRGIPKGIAFSPDGSCLLVTLSETNSVAVYAIDWLNYSIISTPKQILSGISSCLSRPEDIKFTSDGNFCAVSNSSKDTVTFYAYDKDNNYFLSDSPVYTIESLKAGLCFPHGLAFSSDGKYLSVTHFGPVIFDKNSDLSSWGNERKESIAIYQLK